MISCKSFCQCLKCMYFMCHVCVNCYDIHHLIFNSSIFSLEVTMLTAMICINRNICVQNVGECCCNVVYGVLYTSCVSTINMCYHTNKT